MKKGFTLAEIIIVVAIVGFVSMLTVPSVMEMYKYKVLTAQYNRAFSDITTALGNAIQDENSASVSASQGFYSTKYYNGTIGDAYFQAMGSFIDKYIKTLPKVENEGVTKIDTSEGLIRMEGVFGNTVYGSAVVADTNFDISAFPNNNQIPCVLSKYGAAICMSLGNNDSIKNVIVTEGKTLAEGGEYTKTKNIQVVNNKPPVIFYVDTNGQKGPNISGYDLFTFQVNADGTLSDVYLENEGNVQSVAADQCGRGEGYTNTFGCVTRVVENGGRVVKF